MTDAISSVSSNSAASSSSNSSSAAKISDETKKKLEALGLDPSKYTSEAAAQAAITEAQQAQQAQQAQAQPKNSGTSMETIEDSVKNLASKMGVPVGNNDKVDDILGNLSDKISELKTSAGTDETKKTEATAYDNEYFTLNAEYTQATAAQNMTGATAVAVYNKAALGLN